MKKIKLSIKLLLQFVININLSCYNLPTEPIQPFLQDFPSKVGDCWFYATFDSLLQTSYTVVIDIYNKIEISDSQFTLNWKLKSNNNIDSLIVSINQDTVLFYDTFYQPTDKFISKLVFPLKVGNTWLTLNDRIFPAIVVKDSLVSIFGKKNIYAHLIRRSWMNYPGHGFGGGVIDIWFAPKVGMVSIHRKESNGIKTIVNEKWDLINTNVL